jgi:MFS transporter, DHA1 family, tetracycline resistance protein
MKPNVAASMRFIMAAVAIDMLAIGLIIPVLPAMVGHFTGSQTEQAYWYGVVSFAFGVANFFASPILGALSDARGRRPMLLIGFLGLCISFYGTALASSLAVLIAVRVAAGAMQANISVANAYAADISTPQERTKRFGQLGAMQGLGFIVGPVMGGLLGAIDLRLPFVVAGVLASINLLYGWFVLPESLPAERRKPFRLARANPWSSLKNLTHLRGVGLLVGIIACSGLAQFVLYTTWVLYTQFKFGWGPLQNGWSLATVGVASVIVQGLLLPKLLKRFSPQSLLVAGLSSSALCYLGWGLATQGWMMFALIAGNLLGFTITAAVNSMVSTAADASTQGSTLGAAAGLNSLMAVLAPAIGAPILAAVSHLPQGDWRIGAPMFFCATLQLVSMGLAALHWKTHHNLRSNPH